MNGLKQVAVVTQGDGWHVVGLDDQGRIWFGTTRRTTKGRAITWALMDESAEDQGPQPTSAPPPPREELGGDHGPQGRPPEECGLAGFHGRAPLVILARRDRRDPCPDWRRRRPGARSPLTQYAFFSIPSVCRLG